MAFFPAAQASGINDRRKISGVSPVGSRDGWLSEAGDRPRCRVVQGCCRISAWRPHCRKSPASPSSDASGRTADHRGTGRGLSVAGPLLWHRARVVTGRPGDFGFRLSRSARGRSDVPREARGDSSRAADGASEFGDCTVSVAGRLLQSSVGRSRLDGADGDVLDVVASADCPAHDTRR